MLKPSPASRAEAWPPFSYEGSRGGLLIAAPADTPNSPGFRVQLRKPKPPRYWSYWAGGHSSVSRPAQPQPRTHTHTHTRSLIKKVRHRSPALCRRPLAVPRGRPASLPFHWSALPSISAAPLIVCNLLLFVRRPRGAAGPLRDPRGTGTAPASPRPPPGPRIFGLSLLTPATWLTVPGLLMALSPAP